MASCVTNHSSSAIFKFLVGLCSVVSNVSGIIAVVVPASTIFSGIWNDVIITALTINVILAVLVIIDDCLHRRCLIHLWIGFQLVGLFMLTYLVLRIPQPCLVISLVVAKVSWLAVVIFTVVQSHRSSVGRSADKNTTIHRLDAEPFHGAVSNVCKSTDSLPPAYEDLPPTTIESPPPSYHDITMHH